jgi:hypothetical protein
MTTPTRPRSATPLTLGVALLGGLLGPALPTPAQDDVFAPPPPGGEGGAPMVDADELPGVEDAPAQQITIGELLRSTDGYAPAARLGARAHLLRESQQVTDMVVIVDGPNDAARIISSWSGLLRVPVLIDDGTLAAAENIARFTRTFEPAKVIRWKGSDSEPWPEQPTVAAERIVQILGRTIDRGEDAATVRDVLAKMRELGIGPQGVVTIDPTSDAWVAGLALAAGRQQLVTFVRFPDRVNGDIPGGQMRALGDAIQQQLEAVGANWENLGDEVDSITLVGNGALRVKLGLEGEDIKAITDLVGRHRGGVGNRWAWAGAVFGDAQTALYRVMCSLFLPADSAWIFDGYGRGDPWDLYDGTSAGRILERGDYTVEVHDTPDNRVRDWRTAVSRGLDADLVLINSKGMVTNFNLADGKALAGDIPILHTPTAIHIVHSWSARVPGSIRSIAGRWLANGAYLYYGSVDEPFLNAFVETPNIAGRLLAGIPWGVAVRRDNSPPWKLNVLGDPLTTFVPGSKAGIRMSGDQTFPGAIDLKDNIGERLKNEDFAGAIRTLTLAGRDDDAARLAVALLRDRPESVGNATAFQMIMPLYRAGRFADLADAYNRVDPDRQSTQLLQDALWQAGRRVLASGPDTKFEGLLRRNLRAYQEEYDAVELAGIIAARAGTREAVAFLETVSPTIDNDNRRKVVLDAIRKFGGPSVP